MRRQFVVNVECDGAVVRFELRVPGERCCSLTLWLSSAADALELTRALPIERTRDFVPELFAHVEFERRLIAQSPIPRVTYALIFVNVLAYFSTGIGSNRLLGLDGSSLVLLGSNFGPYTTDGDWWRLLLALFLHLGPLHLAFNMWALVSFGTIVERLYGSVAYGVIYLFAGVFSGLASVTWHPDMNSAGASGAIFGILGALIAAQLHNAESITRSVLRPLRTTSLIYIGCALVAGLLSTGVDNAAHIGSMVAGLLLGVVLSRPVSGQNLATRDVVRRCILAVPVCAVLFGGGIWSTALASLRFQGEGLFARTMYWFAPGEVKALRRFRELGRVAAAGRLQDDDYARAVEHEIVPFWREVAARFAMIDLELTSPSYANLEFVRMVADARIPAYDLFIKGLRQHDTKMIGTAMVDLQRVDQEITDKIPKDKTHQ